MRISEITKDSVKNTTLRELVALHYRLHQLIGSNTSNSDLYREKHRIVIDEMVKRNINHRSAAKIRRESLIPLYLEFITLEQNIKQNKTYIGVL
jgi:hypothetical protein